MTIQFFLLSTSTIYRFIDLKTCLVFISKGELSLAQLWMSLLREKNNWTTTQIQIEMSLYFLIIIQ